RTDGFVAPARPGGGAPRLGAGRVMLRCVRGGAAEAAAAPPASGIGGEGGGEGASVDRELAGAPARESALAVNHPRPARTRPRPARESAIAMRHSSPARTRSRPARESAIAV